MSPSVSEADSATPHVRQRHLGGALPESVAHATFHMLECARDHGHNPYRVFRAAASVG